MIKLLRARRSIRRYADRPIERKKLDVLKEAALRSPSSRNIDPCEFVFVQDREILQELARCKPHGASFLAGAPLAIVVCGNPDESDTWIEDCSIASILLQTTAQSRALGSCWIQVRNRMFDDSTPSTQYIQNLLTIPAHIEVESIIAVGYPAESRAPVPRQNLKHYKIHVGRYQGS
jgi:nitroreductase